MDNRRNEQFWWDDVSENISVLYGPNPEHVGWPEPLAVIRKDNTEWMVNGKGAGYLFAPAEKSLKEMKAVVLRILLENRKLAERLAKQDCILLKYMLHGEESDDGRRESDHGDRREGAAGEVSERGAM